MNPYVCGVGAVLECNVIAPDADLLRAWRAHVAVGRAALGWPEAEIRCRVHASGASLALAAPVDQLFTATELNEWAWLASLHERASDPAHSAHSPFHAPGHAAAWDAPSALASLRAHARTEHSAQLAALVAAAESRHLTVLIDEEQLSIGAGHGVRMWPLTALPQAEDLDWNDLHDIPIALVTGSNGKTTSVRLIAAMIRAHGWHTAHSCTDGLYLDDHSLAQGDYSGPAGARAALRHPGADAAVLETARGGLLRRGIAVQRAGVALVTNVSDDHFGEYGVHDLERLAEVKLAVAQTVHDGATLVLNADDDLLVQKSAQLPCAIAWFAADADHALLRSWRERGAATCGVRGRRMILHCANLDHDLGAVADMPLTFAASARYNIANCAAAALSAALLGIPNAVIADVLARFGARHEDNPGRLQHWSFATLRVFVDYAHNPEGLRGLLDVACRERRPTGRLGLLLGQAGNREDAEIRELAAVAADYQPDCVVLKDIEGMLRGRAAGEVAALLRDALLLRQIAADQVSLCLDEVEAAQRLLSWARPGDVLVLPVHARSARAAVIALLEGMRRGGWRAGDALPLP